MHKKPFILLFILLIIVLSPVVSMAQQPFREGRIIYAVTMEPAVNHEGLVQYTGTYTITLKDKKLRTELKMDNGFNSVMIHDEDKQEVYALKEMQGKKYAIQLDGENMAKRADKYKGYSLKEKGGGANVAGLPAQKVVIRYNDGNTSEIYYSKELIPDVLLFEQFPDLQGIPLEFEIKGDDGTKHFSARKVAAEPVENMHFRIPQDYKIISSREYRQMFK